MSATLSLPSTHRGHARLADARLLVALLFGLALGVRVYSAVVVPPWQGPDEPKHFEYARLLADKWPQLVAERRLLNPADASPALQKEVIASLAQHDYWKYVDWLPTPGAQLPERFDQIWPNGTHTQLHRPSLYYLLGAAVLPLGGESLEGQLLALRLLSALLSALVVPLTYLAARRAFPGDTFVPVASAVFVAALPMHVFIGGTANTDNFVSLAGALVALGLARGCRQGWRWRDGALVAGGLLLALAGKRTAVGMLPAVLLAAALWLATLRGRRLAVAAGLGATALAVAVAGLSLLPETAIREPVAAYALNGAGQWQRLVALPWDAPEIPGLLLRYVAALFASFWGIFGWFNILLDTWLYAACAAASAVCLLGLGVWGVCRVRVPSPERGAELAFVAVFGAFAVGTIALALLERLPYLSPHELPQGRYLFVAVAPIAVLHALGARSLLPERWRAWALAAVIAGLITLDAVAYAGYILPFYH